MVLVAGATAVCGLLMLGGVGPATGESKPTGDPVPAPEASTSTTATPTTAPTPVSIVATTTTTSTPTPPPPPLPLLVSASQTMVGAGGLATFEGTCPVVDGVPMGPVVLWLIGTETEVITTGMIAESWSYAWTAPTDPGEFASFTFQFWCGDPTGYERGYPVDLQQVVHMVAVAPPSTDASAESAPPVVIPETD
jgi:hypothetical protein